MSNRFDQIGKQIGREALGASGTTVLQDELAANVQYADLRYDPDPARAAERARLGLLGRFASLPCLFELYSQAPDGAAFRACVAKHLTHWNQRGRAARKRRTKPPTTQKDPFLWIISAGTPRRLLAQLRPEPAARWPEGVYLFGADVLRVGIVAANELPRDTSTLIVRLMAGGQLLAEAIEDLNRLPHHAFEREAAIPILVKWKHVLAKKPRRSPREEEFIMVMRDIWAEEGKKYREEVRKQALLTVLRGRGFRITAAARKRISDETDGDRLQRWLERVGKAESLEAVFAEPARRRGKAARATAAGHTR